MVSILIKENKRKRLRDIWKVLAKDVRKFLTEILTNSDDSYERLEANNPNIVEDIKSIIIELYRSTRVFIVKDQAEGMSRQTIIDIFSSYGADTSQNKDVKSVRGMFGQGATDVMFSSAIDGLEARIISIKDNECTEVVFDLEGDERERVLKFPEPQIDIFSARLRYDIPENGTVVIFGLPKEISIPRTDKLVEILRNFHMLRFLLSKPNRSVNLIDVESEKLYSLKFDTNYLKNLPILIDKNIEMNVFDTLVKGRLILRHDIEKDVDEGILVYENNIVFDNQFFERKNVSNMNKLSGTLELEGAIELIRNQLNSDRPEEIISDSRDGLNKNNEFYKKLKQIVEPLIIVACEKIDSDGKNQINSLKSVSEFNHIFKEINKLLLDEFEEITPAGGQIDTISPPSEGLRFVRPKIKITNGKNYSIKLIVNTELISSGSVIHIENSNKEVIVKPEFYEVSDDLKNPVYIDVSIKSILTTSSTISIRATNEDYSSVLYIDVISKQIHYPAYGLEFFPNNLQKKPDITSRGHLYIDLEKYPLESEIRFSIKEGDIRIGDSLVKISEEHKLTSEIAMINVEISGGLDKTFSKLSASIKSQDTDLKVIVREKEDPNLNKSGYISDITQRETLEFVQSYFQANNGEVVINTANIINQLNLKNWFERSQLNSESKRYIAELCSYEMAKLLVNKKLEKGKIDANEIDEYLDELQKEKLKVYKLFLRMLNG